MKKRTIALALSCTMVLGCAIGSSLAWLTAKDDPVVNVFTPSDINITLTETGAIENNNQLQKDFKMIPGDTLAKDPKVTVESGSEACWLFIEVTESSKLDDFITYEVDTDVWSKLPGEENVYYREITAGDIGKSFYILKGQGESDLQNGCVTVNTTVTKEMMNALTGDTYPKLSFSAYAIQYANLADQDNDNDVDALDAWALISAS